MAPAGWRLDERIGWPLWKIHGPVPLWQEKLRKSIERCVSLLNTSEKPNCTKTIDRGKTNFSIDTS